MKKVRIEFCSSRESTALNILSMAFIDNQNNQCMYFDSCRDFIQNAAVSTFGEYSNVFNLKRPVYDKQTIIAIKGVATHNAEKFETRVLGMIDFLNQIEKKLRLKRTTVAVIENMAVENTGYVLYGSSRWLSCPQMLSLYTLLIRLGMVHDIGDDYQTTITSILEKTKTSLLRKDYEYLCCCKEGIDYILRNGYIKAFGPIKDRLLKFKISKKPTVGQYNVDQWSAAHVYSGIVAWCSGKNTMFDKIPTLKSLLEQEKDRK